MEWISVKDRLPVSGGPSTNYLVYGITTCESCKTTPSVFEATWRRTAREFEYGEFDCGVDATHWMPLPDAPRKDAT